MTKRCRPRPGWYAAAQHRPLHCQPRGVDQKLGAPRIEGKPKAYLVAQLKAFRDGNRRSDAKAQMRNVARSMTDAEIDEVATFYAGKASPGGER